MFVSRRQFLKSSFAGLALTKLDYSSLWKSDFYTLDDFHSVPKIDMHFHLDVISDTFPMFMKSNGFRFISINLEEDGMPLEKQFEIMRALQPRHAETMEFVGAFPTVNFGKEGFVEETIAVINRNIAAGAKGFKVWKNIGMVLKNTNGKFVMIDDPAFTPIFSYLEQEGIPLIGHLGEPQNCWLPLHKITTAADKRYYTRHPEFHMHHFPDSPTYRDQVTARDNLLLKHPKLRFVGAHLGSMEWSVEVMAKMLDRFPNAMLDTAARVDHLQYQSAQNKDEVKRFFMKYQDRIMYGSDTTINPVNDKEEGTQVGLLKKLKNDWGYFATDNLIFENVKVEGRDRAITGLKLPRNVVDKLFYQNAGNFFGMI